MPTDQSYLILSTEGESRRFWSKVEKTDDCWNWISAITKNGYALFMLRGRSVYSHRVSFLESHGSVSDTLVIDHLCRNRKCVNPSHMREITRGENVRIGRFVQREKTHCDHGHPLSGDNVARRGRNMRVCKLCHSRRNKEYRARLRGDSYQRYARTAQRKRS